VTRITGRTTCAGRAISDTKACGTFLSVKSSFRTPSPEIRQIIQADLDDGFEQWADEPSASEVDTAGRTFQERIEVTLEEDGPEWDTEEAELDFWRARGKACGPEMEDVLYPEVEEESSVPDS
jgi:hypothetical protein